MPDTGAVLRCNPDGTELEVFATGLRNPQELAFDEYGNLFTGDNNSDSGDKARWVYVVEGGDSGWRIGYQFIEAPISRGPWNAEKLWDPAGREGQAAYLVPPIANIADGPSGPGLQPGRRPLPERYKDHFFLVDFRGGASGQSGIRELRRQAKGASFELVDSQRVRLERPGDRRRLRPRRRPVLLRLGRGLGQAEQGADLPRARPGAARRPEGPGGQGAAGREGWGNAIDRRLARLLAHADMRVRQEAQFELAATRRRRVLEPRWRGRERTAGPDPRHLGPGPGGPDDTGEARQPDSGAVFGRCSPTATPRCGPRRPGWSATRGIARRSALIGLLRDRARGSASSPRWPWASSAAPRPWARCSPCCERTRTGPLPAACGRDGPGRPEGSRCAQARLRRTRRRPSAWVSCWPCAGSRIPRWPTSWATRTVTSSSRRRGRSTTCPSIRGDAPARRARADRRRASLPLLRRVANANFRMGQPGNAVALAGMAARAELPEPIRAAGAGDAGRVGQPRGPGQGHGALAAAVAPARGPGHRRPGAGASRARLRPRGPSPGGHPAVGSLGMKQAGPAAAAVVADRP